MKHANYYVLSEICSALERIPDDKAELVARTSPGDEAALRDIIRSFILPDFLRLTEGSQQKCKDSLSYFLTTGEAPFGKLLAGLQDSPLGVVTEPAKFFLWVWLELFPTEDYHVDTTGWNVENRRERAGLFWKT